MTSVRDDAASLVPGATERQQYGLLETCVLVAEENAWPLLTDRFPDFLYISPITLAELHARVLTAPNDQVRARRTATLGLVAEMTVLAITEPVARCWSELLVQLAAGGHRLTPHQLWTAAIAQAYGIAIVSTESDLAVLSTVDGPTVVTV